MTSRRLRSGPIVWRIASAWQTSFSAFCDRWMEPEAAGVTKALCFDVTGSLDPAVSDRLKETGTIHIVSASGLQVFVLGFATLQILGRFPVPRWAQLTLAMGVLLLYAAGTGFNPPVMRAVLMSVVGASAYLFRRESDGLSSLALAAVLYLLWRPREVFDPGFQLSFMTVGALVLFAGGRSSNSEKLPLRNQVIDALRLTGVAFVASAPLVAYHFGTLSFVDLPANLLIGLAASAAVVTALGGHVLSFLLPSVGGGLVVLVTQNLVGWILWVTERLGGQGWSSTTVPGFSAYWLVPVYAALLLMWRQRIVHP